MGRFFRHQAGALIAALCLVGATAAEERAGALFDRPVLIIDPGMHTAPIRRMDVDAAGAVAVTGSDDRTVRIWSVTDGRLVQTIHVPTGPGAVGKIYAVAISPDGGTIAAGGWTRWSQNDRQDQIYLFNRDDGAMIHRIEGLPNVVHHLAFSTDGSRLAATLHGSNGVRVYGRDDGWAELWRDEAYDGQSYGASFAADGRLATTSFDGDIRLYDRDGTRIARRASGHARPLGIAFHPEGDRIAVGFDDSTDVALFDGRDLTPLPGPDTSQADKGDLGNVAWSRDGAQLYASGRYHVEGISPVLAWGEAGAGPPRRLDAGQDTVMSLRGLPDGGLLVAAQDPWLGRLDPAGERVWAHGSPKMDPRGQMSNLSVSADGMIVDFGYEYGGRRPARFDLSRLALTLDPPEDGGTATPVQSGLDVVNWEDHYTPLLNGEPLPLERHERSRSLAVHPDGARFVLGTEWSLRAFDADGDLLWRKSAPSVVWAANITGDGRYAVAAYGDGTIRWYRMEDGVELLAFYPFNDETARWVVWTPEGYFASSKGAADVLGWRVNRGWNQAADFYPVTQFKGFHEPEAVQLVLETGDTARALGLAKIRKDREDLREHVDAPVAPGPQLHVLTVGVSDYANHDHLTLDYADNDADDLARMMLKQEAGLYAKVNLQHLTNNQATRQAVIDAMITIDETMQAGHSDVAVVHFSGHGVDVDGNYYLLPHDVNVSSPGRIEASGIHIAQFRRMLKRLGEKGKVLVLLDACHSGSIVEGAKNALPPDIEDVRKLLASASDGVVVISSSTGQEVSVEHPDWLNGAFTEAVLEALSGKGDADRDNWLSVSEMQGFVTDRVRTLTNGKQNPRVAVLGEQHFQARLFRRVD